MKLMRCLTDIFQLCRVWEEAGYSDGVAVQLYWENERAMLIGHEATNTFAWPKDYQLSLDYISNFDFASKSRIPVDIGVQDADSSLLSECLSQLSHVLIQQN